MINVLKQTAMCTKGALLLRGRTAGYLAMLCRLLKLFSIHLYERMIKIGDLKINGKEVVVVYFKTLHFNSPVGWRKTTKYLKIIDIPDATLTPGTCRTQVDIIWFE
jgi:hypothetical protein